MAVTIKRRKRGKGEIARKVCTACIISDQILCKVAKIYRPSIIENKHINSIIQWCVEYYQKYSSAPKQTIQDVFEQKIRKAKDDETIEVLESILELASVEFERNCKNFNEPYYMDIVLDFFREESLKNTIEEANAELSQGNLTKAEEAVLGHNKMAVETDDSINPFTDADEIREAFEKNEEPILSFPGAFGELLNPHCVRDGFIVFIGPEKVGKTFWLQEVLMAGMRARCNIAFFSVGDMSKEQMTIRNCIRLAKRSNKRHSCRARWVPVKDCVKNQNDTCRSKRRTSPCGLGIDEDDFASGEFVPEEAPKEYLPCTNCSKIEPSFWYRWQEEQKPLTWQEAYKLNQKFMQRMRGREYKLKCAPNGTFSWDDVDRQLTIWEELEGFIADLVIFDYMDIGGVEPGSPREFRHQVNEKWKAARRVSQKRHCLVASASQADAGSYEAELITRRNFSEDKRIFAHVTAAFGLNKTNLEKQLGIMRVNPILTREGEFFTDKCVKVLQDLPSGQPLLDSFY